MATIKPTRVQEVGDVTEKLDNYKGPPRQITVDVSRNELRLHDGKKRGGWRIPNLDQLRRLFLTRDSEFGSLQFADEQVGLLARVGKAAYQLRSLASGNGIRITNGDGAGGNPKIDMPLTFSQNLIPLADANLAEDTGFYVIGKGAGANTPAIWLTTADVFIQTLNYDEQVGGTVIQIARNAQVMGHVVYLRLKIGGVWGAWETKTEITYAQGGFNNLYNSVDETGKMWSEFDLGTFVRQIVQSIQYIDNANAAQAKSFNELFAARGVGAGTSLVIPGTFNMATNDRFEVVCSATAANLPAGDSQFATIELEKSDLSWDKVVNVNVVSAANAGPNHTEVRYRFIKTASGYQPADDTWSNLGAAVVATLTGRIRVSIGALNSRGARGARWR